MAKEGEPTSANAEQERGNTETVLISKTSMPTSGLPDMGGHTGLRGVAAVWIVLFHGLVHSQVSVNIQTPFGSRLFVLVVCLDYQGRSLLPLFFLLSGFSLAVVYGSRPWKAVTFCSPQVGGGKATPVIINEDLTVENDQCRPFEFMKFYWNRFARIMPTYYLCTLFAIPQVFLGYNAHVGPHNFVPGLIISLIPTSTLFTISQGYPIDAPGWFECTLVMLYLCFPFWLARAQRKTDDQLLVELFWCYFFQAACLLVSFFLMLRMGYDAQVAYSAARNPLSRFAVFMMGIDAGLLCLRHPTGPLPWPSALLGFFPTLTRAAPTKAWARVADSSALQLLLLTVAVSAVDVVIKAVIGVYDVLQSDVWLTALVPFTHLTLIVALTRDGALSKASRALRTSLATWLGDISAALYLVHEPLMFYLMWATHGFQTVYWPTENCSQLDEAQSRDACVQRQHDFYENRTLHFWLFPVTVEGSLIAGALVYHGFEKPIHRAMRKDKYVSRSSAHPAAAHHSASSDIAVELAKPFLDEEGGGEDEQRPALHAGTGAVLM